MEELLSLLHSSLTALASLSATRRLENCLLHHQNRTDHRYAHTVNVQSKSASLSAYWLTSASALESPWLSVYWLTLASVLKLTLASMYKLTSVSVLESASLSVSTCWSAYW